MKSKRKYKSQLIKILFILIPIALAGCRTNPAKFFPDYDKHRVNIQSINVLSDFAISKLDLSGEHIYTDEEISDIGKKVNQYFLASLRVRGYTIDSTFGITNGMMSYSGFNLDDSVLIDIHGPKSRSTRRVGSRQKIQPQFVHFYGFLEDTPFCEIFPPCTRKLKKNVTIAENEKLDVVAILAVQGAYVSIARQLALGVSTCVATWGTVAIYEVDYTKVHLWLIDRKTRQVLWHDYEFEKGKEPDMENIGEMINVLIKYLPYNISNDG